MFSPRSLEQERIPSYDNHPYNAKERLMRLEGLFIVVLTAFAASAIGMGQESLSPPSPDCTLELWQLQGHQRAVGLALCLQAEGDGPRGTAAGPGRGNAAL